MELRDAFEDVRDLRIVWVMASNQIDERARAFIDEYGLRKHILFLRDESSRAIRRLKILKHNPEPIEEGVPNPTTYLIDRDGVVRFADVRKDFHIWLDPQRIRKVLDQIP